MSEDEPLQVFNSNVFKPDQERRANDSIAVLLMQQIHQKVEDMDKKLTQHITDETLVLAEEIAKLMCSAFPGSDPAGHRTFHEDQMQLMKDRSAFWKKMREEIVSKGILGILAFAAVWIWAGFLKGPK